MAEHAPRSLYDRWARNLLLVRSFGWPRPIVWLGGGIGDALLCTAIHRERAKRGRRRAWQMTNHGELFAGNPDAARVVPELPWIRLAARDLRARTIQVTYSTPIPNQHDRFLPPPRHIIAEICHQSRLSGEVDLRPYLHLAGEELEKGRLARNQVAIQSSILSKANPLGNKEWFPDRFQKVVDALLPGFSFIQLGMPDDPPLSNAVDLRGRTTLREAAAILANSMFFICLEGFLMHLARAVDCRSVVVYGGRTRPGETGYVANENIYTDTFCAPCWRTNHCSYERHCMSSISPADVLEAVDRLKDRLRKPLETDTCLLP